MIESNTIFLFSIVALVVGLAAWVLYHFGVIAAPKRGATPRVLTGFRRQAHGILFGKNTPFTVAYSPTDFEPHVAVFGGTGLGKTSSIILPTLQSWTGTAYVIDISGDISANLDNQDNLVFAPENPDSLPYNALASIDRLHDQAQRWEALERLCFLLMPELPGHNDQGGAADFFNREGRKILTAAFLAYYDAGLDFGEIAEKFVGMSWRDLLNDIAATKHEKAAQFIRSFSGASEQNTAGCKQSADAALKFFATNEIVKPHLRRPRRGEAYIEPAELEHHTVCFVVSDAKLDLYTPLLQLVSAQVLDYFSDRPMTATSKKVLLCLDELASLGKLDLLPALRKFRKRGVRVLTSTQSLADLDLLYGKDMRRAILENQAYKIILGVSDLDSAEYFSKLIGDADPNKKTFFDKIRGDIQDTRPRRIFAPSELGNLKNHLVLIGPTGHLVLRKNFFFR